MSDDDSREKELLTFAALRAANLARLGRFASAPRETPAEWLTWMVGEIGELATLLKRLRCYGGRHKDGSLVTSKEIADEIADIQTYLDLLAFSLNVDLGRATREKFNDVSLRRGVEVWL